MKVKASLVAAALRGGAAATSFAHEGTDRRPGATYFDLEVKITKQAQGGVSPAVVTDSFGNQYVVARKDTEPATVDDRNPTPARAGSWRWWSKDHGRTWLDLPGLPVGVDAAAPGLGGDVTVDGKDRVYVVDSYGADAALLRYRATGLGEVGFDTALPALALAGSPDRPQLAAHGDGVVAILTSGPLGATVRVSRDAGATFGAGYAIAERRCSLAAARTGTWLYVACNDGRRTKVYRSGNDGGSWEAARDLEVGSASLLPDELPAITVAPDGRLHIAVVHSAGGADTIRMRTSDDHGDSWPASRLLNDTKGKFRQVRLTAAPNGKLGVAAYYREFADSGWEVVGSVFFADHGPGPLLQSFARHTPTTDKASEQPTGERLGAWFDGESRMSLVWTSNNDNIPPEAARTAARDIWFVRTQNKLAPGTVFEQERPPIGPLPDCRIKGQVTQVGDWQKIRQPGFRLRTLGGADTITSYALQPLDPARMWVTNGTSVMRSEDAGCTWTEVYSLEPSGDSLSSANARITRLVVPATRLALRSVWLQVEESVSGGAPRPHVVMSRTGAPGSFSRIDTGLPGAGRPMHLSVSATNPDFAYVVVDDGAGHGVLYGTEDAVSWSARGPQLEQVQGPAVEVLELDPAVPNAVWEVVSGQIRHSIDGGRSWVGGAPSDAQHAAAGRVTALDVFHSADNTITVTALSAPESGPAHRLRSTDNGKTWKVDEADGIEAPVESLAHGSSERILVASTAPTDGADPQVYRLDRTKPEWLPVTPKGIRAPFHVSADARALPTFYGMSGEALWRYAGSEIEPGPPPPLPVGPAYTDPAQTAPRPVISPAEVTVSLAPGQSRQVPFDVQVPPRPRRVDLFFLLDTSESMRDDIALLQQTLDTTVRRLQAANVDLWAGLGIYKTEGDPPRYRRVQDVSPIEDFRATIGQLKGSGGAGNETQLIALEQALTGKGEPAVVAPVGSTCDIAPGTQGCAIAPGQQADFRSGALQIVIHATDSPFRNPDGTRRNKDNRPDIAGVAADYAKRGVRIVSLGATSPNPQETGPMYEDLGIASAGARTFAGPGGVDCDGDGRADLRAGQPLVCPMRAAGPANAVLSILRGERTLASIQTTVQDPAGVATGGVAVDQRDAAVPQQVSRSVTVSCSASTPGSSVVTLNARVDAGPLAQAQIAVDCAALPLVPRPQALPPIAPPLLPNPVPPVAPANPLPAAQAQAQVQAQSQAQAQVATGVVDQEQEQLQLVGQLAGGRDDDEWVEQLAMSSSREATERAARAALAGLLLATSVVGAVGYRRRVAPHLAVRPAPVPRRYGDPRA